METKNTIPLNEKYTLNLSEIDKIKSGDTYKSVNALRKAVVDNYNEKNPSGGTKKLIDSVIEHFIGYKKASPNGYKIIITHKNQPSTIDLSIFEQTNRKKLIFKGHINTLFQHFIRTQPDETFITTSELIKELEIFKPFYYEYVKTHYDPRHSNLIEKTKVKKVLTKYGFITHEDYITDRMEKLQECVYTQFSKPNIEDIAKDNGVSATKLWYRGEGVVNSHFGAMWENNYINPLRIKGMPPKYITRNANKQYIKDNNISELEHDFIYPIWNFVKKDIDVSKPMTASELNSIKIQLNHNLIEKLKRASVDCLGNNYHANNKHVLNSLINAIQL